MTSEPTGTPRGTDVPGRSPAGGTGRHLALEIEEWWFAAWSSDLAVVTAHRVAGPIIWYWSAIARVGQPLLHVTDFEVVTRSDPMIIKGASLWAEHRCEVADPVGTREQWSLGNETYAVRVDDPDEVLGRAYGDATPIAIDLEWYAIATARSLRSGVAVDDSGGNEMFRNGVGNETLQHGVVRDGVVQDGAQQNVVVQDGVVHGGIEVLGEPMCELVEVPARRWYRRGAALGPLELPTVVAHRGLRMPFRFPDGHIDDLVLTDDGPARYRRSTRSGRRT